MSITAADMRPGEWFRLLFTGRTDGSHPGEAVECVGEAFRVGRGEMVPCRWYRDGELKCTGAITARWPVQPIKPGDNMGEVVISKESLGRVGLVPVVSIKHKKVHGAKKDGADGKYSEAVCGWVVRPSNHRVTEQHIIRRGHWCVHCLGVVARLLRSK